MKPQQEEWFDEDPIENLRIENEILKLKMQAEYGAQIFSDKEVPPELEALFLHNVNEFEKAWQNVKLITIYDFLQQPAFSPFEDLDEKQVINAIEIILEKLQSKKINIEKPPAIEPLVFYRFLTEEFFKHEIENLEMEGFFRCFDYYEFHPDHHQDIRCCAERFLDNWFRKNVEGIKWDLDKKIVLPNGPILSIEETMQMLHYYFDSITIFAGSHVQIREVKFTWDEKEQTGIGHAKGLVYYETEEEASISRKFGGPFILYFSNEYGFWNIYYFELPGFIWNKTDEEN